MESPGGCHAKPPGLFSVPDTLAMRRVSGVGESVIVFAIPSAFGAAGVEVATQVVPAGQAAAASATNPPTGKRRCKEQHPRGNSEGRSGRIRADSRVRRMASVFLGAAPGRCRERRISLCAVPPSRSRGTTSGMGGDGSSEQARRTVADRQGCHALLDVHSPPLKIVSLPRIPTIKSNAAITARSGAL